MVHKWAAYERTHSPLLANKPHFLSSRASQDACFLQLDVLLRITTGDFFAVAPVCVGPSVSSVFDCIRLVVKFRHANSRAWGIT
eukprot:335091-Rhodomonas_salina.2